MNSKNILLTAFILVAIIQLAIPGKMIWDKEKTLGTGKEFKFETAPIDPTDPFRGKYIILDYKASRINIDSANTWTEGDNIYIILINDSKGFAKVDYVSSEKPENNPNFFKAKVQLVSGLDFKTLTVAFPFDRFYMEESKAYDAEQEYIKSQIDSTKITYAVVSIKNGEAVLKDVMIDGVSIEDIVRKNQEKAQ